LVVIGVCYRRQHGWWLVVGGCNRQKNLFSCCSVWSGALGVSTHRHALFRAIFELQLTRVAALASSLLKHPDKMSFHAIYIELLLNSLIPIMLVYVGTSTVIAVVIVTIGTHRDCVTCNGHAVSKPITRTTITGSQLCLLCPSGSCACVNIT